MKLFGHDFQNSKKKETNTNKQPHFDLNLFKKFDHHDKYENTEREEEKYLYHIGIDHLRNSRALDAVDSFKKSLDSYIKQDNMEATALSCLLLGIAYIQSGRPEIGFKSLNLAESIFIKCGQLPNTGKFYFTKEKVADANTLHLALDSFLKTIRFQPKNKEQVSVENNHKNDGMESLLGGQFQNASDSLNKALGMHVKLKDKTSVGEDYSMIGFDELCMGRFKNAMDYYKKALEIHIELKDTANIGKDYQDIASAFASIGSLQDAMDYYKKALEIHIELEDTANIGKDYEVIGSYLSSLGKDQDAIDYYKKALVVHTRLRDTKSIGKAHFFMGVALKNLGQDKEALDSCKKALVALIKSDERNPTNASEINKNRIIEKAYSSKLQASLARSNTLLQINTTKGDTVGMVISYISIGITLRSMQRNKDAMEYFQKGNALIEDDAQVNDLK